MNKGDFSNKSFKEILENKDQHNQETIDHAIKMLEYYSEIANVIAEREESEEFTKNNLEYDLRSTDWIIEKAKSDELYAQNIYAALCNNQFQKIDNWCILSDEKWSCSWRYAGGIAAHLRGEGDYIDYYCSGIGTDDKKVLTYEVKEDIMRVNVPESIVTDEIKEDFRKLGWVVLDNDQDDL